MKKLIYSAAAIALLFNVSCKKSAEGNTTILITDSGLTKSGGDSAVITNQNMDSYTDRYVTEDGSGALVTFDNSTGKKMISIESNKMTIKAPQIEALSNGGVYADHDFEITSKNDTITIIQGNNVITMKKARTSK
ncbi:hypothetical protein [Chryseobacterium sp. MP_3.2]|uniref:hypothetical protein n=1 Tax=Chryseobacterium sp. MP_3.2 TaxID=3071712 RepID=UPI002E02552D|nr:hypothetical protein [Chryseobacterium sp. MP_3.2]